MAPSLQIRSPLAGGGLLSAAERRWRWTGDVIAAHVEMLTRVGLVDGSAAETVIEAIRRVSESPAPGDADPLALVNEFDGRLAAQTTGDVAAIALVGRGAIDIAATVARMELRADLLNLAEVVNELRGSLLELAETQAVSVMPVLIDGGVAQPGTIGQWLGGLIAPLGRAATALESAYANVNRSPLGAGSHAGAGLENDRVATAEALGFEAPIANGFDAVASVDHFATTAEVAASVAAPIGRWLNELVVLVRTEPASLRLAESWRRGLADMPQFDAPVGVEALAARCEALVGKAGGVRALGMRAAYAPVAARLGDMLDLASGVIAEARDITSTTHRLAAEEMEFNRAYLANRAGRAFSTASDLVDFLMIEEGQDPAAARTIAALTISRAREQGIEASGITPELIDGAALLAIGQELKVEFEAISRYLAPRRFIERRTSIGGASPAATRAYIESERTKLNAGFAWRAEAAGAIERVASDA